MFLKILLAQVKRRCGWKGKSREKFSKSDLSIAWHDINGLYVVYVVELLSSRMYIVMKMYTMNNN